MSLVSPHDDNSASTGKRKAEGRRKYRACISCKEQKVQSPGGRRPVTLDNHMYQVRCDLGNPDNPQPPCSRCRRLMKECVFDSSKRVKARYTNITGSSEGIPITASHDGASTQQIPFQNEPLPGATVSQEEARSLSETGSIEEKASAMEGPVDWPNFPLCSEGWLTPSDADFLLDQYGASRLYRTMTRNADMHPSFFKYMHPLLPVVDNKYSNTQQRKSLAAKEQLLCTAILAAAARYGTYERPVGDGTKFHDLHDTLSRRINAKFQSCLWYVGEFGRSDGHLLGVLEACLICIEWPPRLLLQHSCANTDDSPLNLYEGAATQAPSIKDAFFAEPGRPANEEIQDTYYLTRRVTRSTWRLLGLAISLADVLALADVWTRPREGKVSLDAPHTRRSRVRDLLVPMSWEAAFKMGRCSIMQLPPAASIQDQRPGSFEHARNLRTDLYRLMKLFENSLYGAPSTTIGQITSGRYPDTVASLRDVLSRWWTNFQSTRSCFLPSSLHSREYG